MEKRNLLLLIIALLISVGAQGQNYLIQNFGVTDMNDLTKEQCELGLTQADKQIKTGKTLTFVGGAISVVGIIIYSSSLNDIVESDDFDYSDELNKGTAGTLVTLAGGTMASIGIPLWLVGSNRKSEFELHLKKYDTPQAHNTAYGVGFRVIF